jgi:hypothetical protein
LYFDCRFSDERKIQSSNNKPEKNMKKQVKKPVEAQGVRAVVSISTKLAKNAAIGEPLKIAGMVKKVEKITTPYGEQSRFVGEFAAEIAGQKFQSRKCYLPSCAAELLESADLENGQAQFALVIKKMSSDKTKQGYVWSVEAPMTPQVVASPALALLEKCE